MDPKMHRASWITITIGGAAAIAILAMIERSEVDLRSRADFLPGNPRRGGELFFDRECARCHSISGIGGKEASDLARLRRAPSDLDALAGEMWNHAPEMWEKMASQGYSTPRLTPSDFADVMAFLFAAGYLEEQGDAARGKSVLLKKRCLDCHSTEGAGPELGRWSSSVNPILWTTLFWNHAPAMEETMEKEGIPWPELTASEVVDLLTFLRASQSEPRRGAPLPGDPEAGRSLFRRHCRQCHRAEEKGGDVGPDLGASRSSGSLAGLAASLWNHAPAMGDRMKELGISRPSFSEREMADLITYLFAIRYFEAKGDGQAGARVYARSCESCHGSKAEGAVGPSLESLSASTRRTSATYMASALWNHGQKMYEEMKAQGREWPLFRDHEMRDLLEYLRSFTT